MQSVKDPGTFHLDVFQVMNVHVLEASVKADEALELAADALKRLYIDKKRLIDLTAIVTLSRVCEASNIAINDHFRKVYAHHKNINDLDARFLIAFQDVMESVFGFIKHISDLGTALHVVRDVEALMSV